MILYIHGFNSSSQSGKALEMQRWLQSQGRELEWICPDLPHQPKQAIQLLTELIQQAQIPPKLVGSSLGGFYATYLAKQYDLKAVLINPAVHASLLLRPLLGIQQHSYYSDLIYTLTQSHLDEWSALELIAPSHPEKMLVFLETGDETLNWQDAAHYYRHAHQVIFQGGDHGFTRFRDVLELIDRF